MSKLRPVQTASPSQSIWSNVSEHDFRCHLVALEKGTNAVPIGVIAGDTFEDDHPEMHVLPLSVERQLADDLAYLAAVTEGAQSVAAVCLEQHIGEKLLVKVAGMDVVNNEVREMLSGIARVMEHVAAYHGSGKHYMADIFALVIKQHSQKLLGRMRSVKWIKPKYLRNTHKKPLHKDFENIAHRVRHTYPRKGEWNIRELLIGHIRALEKEYATFETAVDESEMQDIKRLVKATFDFCRVLEIKAFASQIENIVAPTPQVAAAVKTLRQLEKIGAYWRIARSLVATARKYSSSFHHISLEYVKPYAEAETAIAYETWAKTMHVHAEVQLVVEYAIRQQNERHKSGSDLEKGGNRVIWPRTVGTSKYLCYMCYLFLREHGGFGQALNSHGRLFDQWTVPDLKDYDFQTRNRFAEVLQRVDDCVLSQTEALHGNVLWRAEPMTSRQNLFSCCDGIDEEYPTEKTEPLEMTMSSQ